jgi:hypothetical protein
MKGVFDQKKLNLINFFINMIKNQNEIYLKKIFLIFLSKICIFKVINLNLITFNFLHIFRIKGLHKIKKRCLKY